MSTKKISMELGRRREDLLRNRCIVEEADKWKKKARESEWETLSMNSAKRAESFSVSKKTS